MSSHALLEGAYDAQDAERMARAREWRDGMFERKKASTFREQSASELEVGDACKKLERVNKGPQISAIVKGEGNRGDPFKRVEGYIVAPEPVWDKTKCQEMLSKWLEGQASLGTIILRVGDPGKPEVNRTEAYDGWNRLVLCHRFVNNLISVRNHDLKVNLWFGTEEGELPAVASKHDLVLTEDERHEFSALRFRAARWVCTREEAARRAADVNKGMPPSSGEKIGWFLYGGTPGATKMRYLVKKYEQLCALIGGRNDGQKFVIEVFLYFSSTKEGAKFETRREATLRKFVNSTDVVDPEILVRVETTLDALTNIVRASGPLPSTSSMRSMIKRLLQASVVVLRQRCGITAETFSKLARGPSSSTISFMHDALIAAHATGVVETAKQSKHTMKRRRMK